MSVSLGYVIFYVSDVNAAIGFYQKAFALEERFITPESDYGELKTGSTTLAFVSHELAQTNLAKSGGFTPLADTLSPPGVSITLVTNDVKATLSTAVEAGARIYAEPVDKPWDQTVAYLIDPFGALVEVATPVPAA